MKKMNKLLIEIQKDPELVTLVSKLSKEELDQNLLNLYRQKQDNDMCANCKGKIACMSAIENNQSKLVYKEGLLEKVYYPCKYIDHASDNLSIEFMPIRDTGGKVEKNSARANVFKAMEDSKKTGKGIYLHGPFGCGKTYLMMKYAKALMKTKEVVFVFYPEMVRFVKTNVVSNADVVNRLINRYKDVDVLILDDIGREGNTAYIRDEVLGVILQYRMMEKLPTFMTSNYNILELNELLANTRDKYDGLKASAIIERICYLMNVVELKDKNYRV